MQTFSLSYFKKKLYDFKNLDCNIADLYNYYEQLILLRFDFKILELRLIVLI